MTRASSAAVLVLVGAVLGGCLQSTHRISHGELVRLANTPPEQRGGRVRVVQELSGESPPAAEPVNGNVHVVVVVDGGGGGGGHRGGGGHGAAPVHQVPGRKPHLDLAKAKADDAAALFVVAAVVAVTLAATEGARYDGWVQLHPMHPVHLYGPGGYLMLPLAQIDPETAAWAERAVVRPHEGPWTRLGRAPLDRQGFTYSVLLGVGEIPSAYGDVGQGTTGRVQFGYFPSHELGVQLDWGFGVRDNRYGESIFDDRLGVELTFAPLDAGWFHGGVFGGVALASRFEDGVARGRRDAAALSGGALLQLELTTRLALTGRLGVGRAYGELTRDATVGVSIY